MSPPGPWPYDPRAQNLSDWLRKRMAEGGTSPSGGGGVFAGSPADDGHKVYYGPTTQMDIPSIMREFYRWSDAKVRGLAAKLFEAGILKNPNATRNEIWDGYKVLLMESSMRNAAGKPITPMQILNGYMKNPIGSGVDGAGAKPSVYTTTQQNVNLTDPKAASAMLFSALQDRLGREPSAAERQAFIGALNAAEEANPTITSTTYKLTKSGAYDTSTRTTGGVTAQGFLADYTERHNQKEYGAYQAATTYMNALMQAIGAPVG